VGLAVPVLLLLPLPDALGERGRLLLTEGEAPLLRDAVGLPVAVELQLSVEEGELEGVAVLLPVCVPLGVGDRLCVGDRLLLLLSLPVAEPLAPLVREEVGLPDRELLRLALLEGVACAVPLPVCVELPVPELLEVGVPELLGAPLLLPVLEALAPGARLAAGLPLWLLLLEGVAEGVPLPEGVPEALCVAVPVQLPELLPVEEALAPGLREAVGELLAEELRLCVPHAVAEAVPVPVTVPLVEGVPLALWLGVMLLLQEVEPVLEALAPAVREAVALTDRLLLALWVVEPVLLPLPVAV
jgi:hypothetical protein